MEQMVQALRSGAPLEARAVLQVVQPALLGFMDGAVSTLAPLFAAAELTHSAAAAFFVGLAGALGAREVAIAVLMGAVAVPGAFLARSIAKRLPLDVHTATLDAVVMIGGGTMVALAFVQ